MINASGKPPTITSQNGLHEQSHSFLVRIWRSDGNWRATVIDPHTQNRKGFASREQLIQFITQQMGG